MTVTYAVLAKSTALYAPQTGGLDITGEDYQRLTSEGWIETMRWTAHQEGRSTVLTNVDITVADILSEDKTFGDVHPHTCTNVDLRNLKANALSARIEYNIRKDAGITGPQTAREIAASNATADLAIELTGNVDDALALVHTVIRFAEQECA